MLPPVFYTYAAPLELRRCGPALRKVQIAPVGSLDRHPNTEVKREKEPNVLAAFSTTSPSTLLTSPSIRLRDPIEAVRTRANGDREYLTIPGRGHLAARQRVPVRRLIQFVQIFHSIILAGLRLAGNREMRGVHLAYLGDMDRYGYEDREALGRAQAGRAVVGHLNGHDVRAR